MRARLARVLWWLGALAGLGVFVCAGWLASIDGMKSIPGLLLALAAPMPFWACCYIVAGTFWRPPNDA